MLQYDFNRRKMQILKLVNYKLLFEQKVPVPALQSIDATNLDTIDPRFLILHCLEYGRYGITPIILLADEVLHAYAMISNSIMASFTSL